MVLWGLTRKRTLEVQHLGLGQQKFQQLLGLGWQRLHCTQPGFGLVCNQL